MADVTATKTDMFSQNDDISAPPEESLAEYCENNKCIAYGTNVVINVYIRPSNIERIMKEVTGRYKVSAIFRKIESTMDMTFFLPSGKVGLLGTIKMKRLQSEPVQSCTRQAQ